MLVYNPVYDEPLLRGQPPLDGHLTAHQGGPLNGVFNNNLFISQVFTYI